MIPLLSIQERFHARRRLQAHVSEKSASDYLRFNFG